MKIVLYILLFLAICASIQASLTDVDSVYKGWNGRPDTVKVFADSSYTAAQKDSIQQAIDRWNASGAVPKLASTTNPSEAKIKIRPDSSVSGAGACRAHPSWSQPYDSCTIRTNTTRTIGMTELATHELGHALGLNDTDPAKNPNDTMKSHGTNGSGGALSAHDSSEIKAASRIALGTSSVVVPVAPPGAIPKIIITPVLWPLSRYYTPEIAACAMFVIDPMGDYFLEIHGISIVGDHLEIRLAPNPMHWSGMVHIGVRVTFPESLALPPEEFIAKLYVNETPVPPTEFTCWFEAHQEGALTVVEWIGMNDYPHVGELRATLTVDNSSTYYAKDGLQFVVQLSPGPHNLALRVDDFQGNYSGHSSIFNVLAVEENRPLPSGLSLSAYPNPFNSAISITLEGIAANQTAKIEIFDISGKLVFESEFKDVDNPLSKKIFNWEPSPNLESGVYLIRAKSGNSIATTKIELLK